MSLSMFLGRVRSEIRRLRGQKMDTESTSDAELRSTVEETLRNLSPDPLEDTFLYYDGHRSYMLEEDANGVGGVL